MRGSVINAWHGRATVEPLGCQQWASAWTGVGVWGARKVVRWKDLEVYGRLMRGGRYGIWRVLDKYGRLLGVGTERELRAAGWE